MTTRTATCRCGALTITCTGEPVRVSVCYCLPCQQRTGAPLAAQDRWRGADVELRGDSKQWTRRADSGHAATYSFCPTCGSTVAFVIEAWEGVTAVTMGAFADPVFPAPKFSVYEHRKHDWIEVTGDDVKHSSTTSAQRMPGLNIDVDPKDN